ncbi:hypothetical protein VNO80_13719 [Phaseolus coccineus]|uniref:Uncharacterized protein n=1 Tax=Phaseolus coccineus TaxID=3886 RepID=A0AAN9RBI2_PHACN
MGREKGKKYMEELGMYALWCTTRLLEYSNHWTLAVCSIALRCHCFAAMKRESSSWWRRMTSAKERVQKIDHYAWEGLIDALGSHHDGA